MRKYLLPLLILVPLMFLSGCDDSDPQQEGQSESSGGTEVASQDPSVSNTGDKTKIALVMKTLTNPFFIEMEKGARRAEQDLGITLVVKTAAQETSATQQISIVDKLVREGEVQAIVIAPADSVRLIPSLKAAQDKGIHIINIDNRLDPDFLKKSGLKMVPFISVDNQHSAYLSAKHIADGVTQPAEVVVLEGIREASNANDRKAGAMQAFAENPNLTVVASITAHWQIDEAYEITKKIFEDHPNVSLMFCANDMMALGAIEYLKESNRTSVAVAAFDAIADARAAIKEGWLSVSIDQQPDKQGYLGIEQALRAIQGKELPEVTMLDGLVVTE